MPKDQTQQQEAAPNLPTEGELKQQIDKLIPCVQCDGSGAYAVDNGYGEPEPEQCQYCYQCRFPAIEKLTIFIHHYVTKRELEAKLKQLEWLKEHSYAYEDDDSYQLIDKGEIEAEVSKLKAQKEQEK